MSSTRTLILGASLAVFFAQADPARAASCDQLSRLSLPHTTITLANVVEAGAFVQFPRGRGQALPATDLPAFCRVTATLMPSDDSSIKFELWMPVSGWNGKFVIPGNGGFAGAIAPAALATALRRGYAAATTDTGHEGGSGSFMLDHPEKLTDFADRAIHEMTVQGKAIVAAFYGNGPKFSYFNGCSTWDPLESTCRHASLSIL